MRNKAYRPLFFLLIVHCSLLTVCRAQQDEGLSQEEKTRKAREYYASGKALLEQGDYKGADAQFKKAQGLLTQNLPSDKPKSSPSGSSQNLTLSEADRQPPEETLSPAKKAWEAAKKGANQEAISLYQEAITALAPNANLYYNLALEYLKTKRFREAAQAFKRAIQLNPRDKDAYFNLAVLYESYLNDKKQALGYYSQYLKYASPNDNTAEAREWVRQIKKELKAR